MPPRQFRCSPELLQLTAAAAMLHFTLHSSPAPTLLLRPPAVGASALWSGCTPGRPAQLSTAPSPSPLPLGSLGPGHRQPAVQPHDTTAEPPDHRPPGAQTLRPSRSAP
ncbi:hypothetical protein NDU88_005412 [Pleurodeles waltl]|uniref:Uncharacterized protein n=1 Tax=Pleurodeles waltl TaxID=8319 RepID=A0AAV7TWI9_PLEWA|nr:hypothetical protein NDU88_005412 [Pleurodeles waltl]